MRDAERVCDPPRPQHGLGRAAALAVGGPVGPQLQRHRDDLGAALALQQRRDGRVDAPAERDQDPLACPAGPTAAPPRGQRRERPVKRVGGELGGVAVAAARPPELLDPARGRSAPHRARRPFDELADRGGRGPAGGAALGVLGDRSMRPSRTRSEIRTRSPHGAPPAAPLRRTRRLGPAAGPSAR